MNINVSHNDLDGISCSLLLKHVSFTECINIGYDKIQETLEFFNTELHNRSCKTFYVTDLNFKLEELIFLYKMMKNHPKIKFVYIDHHDYNKKQHIVIKKMNELPNADAIHNIEKSATLLTFEHLKINNSKIELYVQIVNAYDIWLVQSKYHKLGLDLNNYFWFLKAKSFSYEFKNFNLKNKRFRDKAEQIRDNSKEHFLSLEEKGLCFVENGIRLIFTDDYLGMINTYYKEDVIIIGTSYGRISVRIDERIDEVQANTFKNTVVQSIENSQYFISGGGHNHAFGLTFSEEVKNNYEVMLDLLKHVFKVINKCLSGT